MTRTDKALFQRWQTEEGLIAADRVWADLIAGRPPHPLGPPGLDGRTDLRGLPAPDPTRLARFELGEWFVEELGNTLTLRDVRLEALDLTGARLRSLRFHRCAIADCSLQDADCRDWRLWGTRVVDCSFDGADLRGAAVGTGLEHGQNLWERVSFVGADFRVGACQSAAFVGCDFTTAKVVKVNFAQCRFERCRFRGAISQTVFDGRGLDAARPAPPPMQAVDFTGAVFHDVGFKGWNLAAVAFPDDPDLLVVDHWPCVLRETLAGLGDDQRTNARLLRAVTQNELRQIRTTDEHGVVNLRDFDGYGDDDYRHFVAHALRQAGARCR